MRIKKRLNRQRQIRKFRVTNAVKKVSTRKRLSVFRSAKHIYAQVIDDEEHKTVVSAGTMDKAYKALGKSGGNCEAAAMIGKMVAEKAVAAGVTEVAFDRGGHKYHGRVKALADAARDAGLDIGAKPVEEEKVEKKPSAKKPKAEKGEKKAKK